MICQAAHFGLDDLLDMAAQAPNDPDVYDQFVTLQKVPLGVILLILVHSWSHVSVLYQFVVGESIILDILPATIEQVTTHLTSLDIGKLILFGSTSAGRL